MMVLEQSGKNVMTLNTRDSKGLKVAQNMRKDSANRCKKIKHKNTKIQKHKNTTQEHV
jgi:hypothetical protein